MINGEIRWNQNSRTPVFSLSEPLSMGQDSKKLGNFLGKWNRETTDS